MVRLAWKLAVLGLCGVSLIALTQSAGLSVLALSPMAPLPEARRLVAEERYAEAAAHLRFFVEHGGVEADGDAARLLETIEQERATWRYQSAKALEGLLKGTSDETIGRVTAVVSDLLIIGDIRDLVNEGLRELDGEEADEVLVALAGLGVLASSAQVASGAGAAATAGAAAPAFVGASATKSGLIVLKVARKLDALPPWLVAKVLGTARAADSAADLQPLTKMAANVNTLGRTPGGLHLLRETTDAASLGRMADFANTYGDQSLTLYRLGGHGALRSLDRAKELGRSSVFLAATFGRQGLRALDRTGAITALKYAARLSKMGYKGDLLKLLAGLLARIPAWLHAAIVLVGLFLLVPFRAVFGPGRARIRPARQHGGSYTA